MGLSSSKQKQTNDPSKFAKPYITAGAGALQDAYGQTAGLGSSISQNLAAQLPGLSQTAFGANPELDAARGYASDVVSGKYLAEGNPYLAGIASDTQDDVTNRVQSAFGAAGRTGSGANQLVLTKGLASARNNLYGAEYDAERGRQSQAAALVPTLDAARYNGLGAYLQAASAATGIPQSIAGNYAGGLGSLLGGYQTRTATTNPGVLGGIGQAIDIGTSLYDVFKKKG